MLMLTYADLNELDSAAHPSLVYADVCRRMLTYADFLDSAAHPSLRARRGGLFMVVAPVSPPPAAGQWVHLVASYHNRSSTLY